MVIYNKTMNSQDINHKYWMTKALGCASKAQQQGEVPVGSVLVLGDQLISQGWNSPISSNDPTAHAEIQALRNGAQALRNYRLINTTLYVSLEPCIMCVGAMVHARIKNLVFGAYDPKTGAVQSVFQILDSKYLNHRIQYQGGILEEDCGNVLKSFFLKKR